MEEKERNAICFPHEFQPNCAEESKYWGNQAMEPSNKATCMPTVCLLWIGFFCLPSNLDQWFSKYGSGTSSINNT